MNGEIFAHQVEAMRRRLQKLYQEASQSPLPPPELVPRAFMELGTASEELQVALEELRQQNQELLTAREEMALQRQHYQELFERVPNAYIVSDAYGIILEANRTAALLLNVSQEWLVGKPLIDFVAVERRMFRDQLNRVRNEGEVQEWEMSWQPHRSDPIKAQVTVAPVPDPSGKVVTLRWLLREMTNRLRAEATLEGDECDPIQERPKDFYSKGDIISLQPESIWLVCQGLVKLTTLADNGVEVLVGLAGPDMVFGSGLTDLQIYQAQALSKRVQLACIPVKEIETSPHLAENLLPKINQRLRQAESLLAISGQRRVGDRLYRLLLLLKQEIGQPVAGGTRLSVRLTHEDLANACGTTRVTITRMVNKLQQQGKITFDPQHHIIVLETSSNPHSPGLKSAGRVFSTKKPEILAKQEFQAFLF